MLALVSVTGPIAAGATTCCARLAEVTGWNTALERGVETKNRFFALYHSDPRRYAFHNQVTFLTQSGELHQHLRRENQQEAPLLQDFTPFEHMGVYGRVQRMQGLLTSDEAEVLTRLSHVLETATYIVPQVLVYRDVAPADLLARVQSRARPGEQMLSRDFLQAVQERFEEWLADWRLSPVIKVEADVDLLGDIAEVRRLADEIRERLDRP
jgi:deoxyadenosine/deoxycytidine kinase